ncbi:MULTISPECIES: hypothetical protein [Acinetobacter]|uniref:Zinc ribbon domain-containing protein n=4 Tax=Acinetobacter haemolyticus TaxID=29430 RepID=A0AAW4JA39_ACIHA|nr:MULTISPECIES: hypothetical protein [Acinetobacter]MBO3656875.1 hypothetical protein [Acinetobacter haemolyticus]MCU4379410.1 hypothetical protein [Acinetobacter haemolyticus]MCU4388720.1 hypothetical protein [Acinetobacter haemolyticus]MEB6677577.1 hypothetical protein [Acinetobacter haemolyticus]QXZ25853.1 hypothetical protein I6L22_11615 [Acinetobacter haemolyticus]
MMLSQYHCACCDKVVASTDKECPYCGSQHIRSPYGLWMFCIAACLVVVVIAKVVHVYVQQNHEDQVMQKNSLFEIFKHENTHPKN